MNDGIYSPAGTPRSGEQTPDPSIKGTQDVGSDTSGRQVAHKASAGAQNVNKVAKGTFGSIMAVRRTESKEQRTKRSDLFAKGFTSASLDTGQESIVELVKKSKELEREAADFDSPPIPTASKEEQEEL